MQTEPIPGLPEHVVSTHVLKFLEDPADLARFKTVSRAARDAVVATRRRVRELEEKDAAELGCLNALRRLERRGLLDKQHFCSVAAGSGHLHVLKWGREIGCPWDAWTCAAAAWGGHLEMLRYLRRAGCPWDARTIIVGARGGHPEAHLEVLTWLRAETKCRYDDRICRVAAEHGARYVVGGMCDRCGCACEMHSE
jgi:hypothetical protein